MNEATRQGRDPAGPMQTSFSAPFEKDGVTVITATSTRLPSGPVALPTPSRRAATPGAHPMGAFVIRDGTARWHPAVDLTRLLTTAEIVAGAVLVAHVLAGRPGTPKAQVTMGPGGWVSMKGGSLAVRPARRPWDRPRPLPFPKTAARAPVWARVLSAVPLQALVNLDRRSDEKV
jgi:hypothetical protein